MANLFSNTKVDNNTVGMSNGLTSVFLETFCLAGASIAHQNFQKDLMIWFAQRDSTIRGMGLEGFDMSEVIWKRDLFPDQQRFILSVLQNVRSKTNWHLLDYHPNAEMLFERINEFEQLVKKFQPEFINENEQDETHPFEGAIHKYDKCKKHKVFMHFAGCIICNNQ